MTINANFDPTVQSELEWAAKQIKKVLEQTPEIKVLEEKLGMIGEVNTALDESIAGLKSVVDFNKMILPEAKEDEEGKEEKGDDKEEEKKDDKEEDKKDEKEEKKDEKKEDEKIDPKHEAAAAAAEGDAKDEKAEDAKPEEVTEETKAVQVHKKVASMINDIKKTQSLKKQ